MRFNSGPFNSLPFNMWRTSTVGGPTFTWIIDDHGELVFVLDSTKQPVFDYFGRNFILVAPHFAIRL